MKAFAVDVNGRTTLVAELSVANNFSKGVLPDEVRGLIRVKNTGSTPATLRLVAQSSSTGVVIGAGETEYFAVPEHKNVEILSGELNIMY